MSNSHHLTLIATQNVFSYLLSLGPNYEKWQLSAPNDLKMTLNAKRTKVPLICWTTTHESQILLTFALRLLVFQIIEVFDFSLLGYNGAF